MFTDNRQADDGHCVIRKACHSYRITGYKKCHISLFFNYYTYTYDIFTLFSYFQTPLVPRHRNHVDYHVVQSDHMMHDHFRICANDEIIENETKFVNILNKKICTVHTYIVSYL